MTSQLKSAFLAKLPVEIRYQIYELVFGDKIIAFTPGGGSDIRHCVCPAKGEKFHWFSWKTNNSTSWCYCTTHEREAISSRLLLLLPCCQIYSESVNILWFHNPIHVQMMGGPLDFRIFSDIQAALAPRNFHAIRSLDVSFIHPNISRWAQVVDDEWFTGWNGAGDPGGNFMTAEQEGRFTIPTPAKIQAGVASAEAGFDLAFPVSPYWGAVGETLTAGVRNGKLSSARLTEMATLGVGMTADFTKPHRKVNARDPAAKGTLLTAAIEGHVLVTNIGNSLPLRKPQLLSLFGHDARFMNVPNPDAATSLGVVLSPWGAGSESSNVTAKCPNMIVVIHNARIHLVDQWIDLPNITAVIFGHLPGQDGGRALAQILFGDVSPSGKLSYMVANESDYNVLDPSVPQEQFSLFPQSDFSEGLYYDYHHFDAQDIEPRFEFGYGMSYTTFKFSSLHIARTTRKSTITPLPAKQATVPGGNPALWEELFVVSATVANTGSYTAQEVAQLWVKIPREAEPVRQLRGFDKQNVPVGGRVTVKFSLTRKDFSVWDVKQQEWVLRGGEHRIYVGSSSRNLPLEGRNVI
ncbi:hypothetical protein BDW59DRAFT_163810 [Aspergillus cavernicola]|uniref:beta-glucosidase n=1 Tax=Aspergillus cavernicola TaxID=176166 RepID=A0ABR4I389_9EURO